MQSVLNLQATTSKYRNVPVLICCLRVSGGLFDHVPAASNPSVDVRSISLEAGDPNTTHIHEYASSKRVDEKQIDIDGSVRSGTVKIFDDVVVDGLLIRKLISKDGKPLPSERARRLAGEEKKRTKAHEFRQEVFDAFSFRPAGEEEIGGRKNWLIEATERVARRSSHIYKEALDRSARLLLDESRNHCLSPLHHRIRYHRKAGARSSFVF
jgi:hypothetical protein